MAVFSIDTDKVMNVASDVDSLSSSSSSVASSVSGYDTSNEDGFDFSGAKSAIENNVDGMKVKVSNTSVLLEAVVGTHTTLQDSAGGGTQTGSTTRSYGGYTYSGGGSGNYYSGGGITGGGYGDSIPVSELRAMNNSTNNAIIGQVTERLNGAGIDVNSLSVADPLANGIESALKENPSAYEKLVEELGKVKSTISSAESALNEELEVTLSSNGIKKVTPEGIVAESLTSSLLVIESSTKTVGLTDYIKIANEVAKEYKIELRFLDLDEIIEFGSSKSYSETKTDDVIIIDDDKNKEINEYSDTSVDEEDKKSEENDTSTISITDNKTKENNSLENNNDETITTEIKDDEEEPKEEIINDDEEEPKEEKKDSKSNSISKTIKNEEKYNMLTKLPTKGNITNDIMNSPVTMIMKNNLIVAAETGILTKERIESLIKNSGIEL